MLMPADGFLRAVVSEFRKSTGEILMKCRPSDTTCTDVFLSLLLLSPLFSIATPRRAEDNTGSGETVLRRHLADV